MNGGGGKRRFLLALCAAGAVLFAGLGIWQVERLAWKLDLIARVDERVRAPAGPLPPSSWRKANRARDEYRHVRVRGEFLRGKETLVDALTERGPGFWVLTPLQTENGVILINRGFVPARRTPGSEGPVAGRVFVSGLLRLTEPGGRFLRPNVPGEDRWYSRDVAAIGRARGLRQVAPFFIDADAAANPGGYPVGGLTVVKFRNAHLVYALTWFTLAGLCVAGLVLTVRSRKGGG